MNYLFRVRSTQIISPYLCIVSVKRLKVTQQSSMLNYLQSIAQ